MDLLLCAKILFANIVLPIRCGTSMKIQSVKFLFRFTKIFTREINPLNGTANVFLPFSPVLTAAVAGSESEQLILGESEGAVCEDEPEHLTQGISIRNLSKVMRCVRVTVTHSTL